MDLPKIISVDDHVVEPGDLWSSRLPQRYAEIGPRLLRKKTAPTDRSGVPYTPDENGVWADIWFYEDLVMPMNRLSAACGLPGELRNGTVIYDEIAPGAWQQGPRLAAMDENHVEASVCFPNVLPRFCGQTFAEAQDKDLALLCVQAYNDWIIDEWCGGPGRGRLIPLTLVPLWDVDLAIAEVRRTAGAGSHAVTFPEDPLPLGLPGIYSGYWDPFFAACVANDTVVCMHIGSSSRMTRHSPDAPQIVWSTLMFENSMHSVLDYVFSGTLARHPGLRLAYAEGQAGWLPFAIERAERLWHERSDNSFGTNGVVLDEPPSHYTRRQVFNCIFDDEAGLALRDRLGMSQICFEVDYPHADSTYPHTDKVLTSMCTAAGLNDDEVYALVRGNAISLFGLERFGITK